MRCPGAVVPRDYGFNHVPDARSSTLATPSPSRSDDTSRRRVQAVVALRLLETLRAVDLPPEFLEDEDPTVTMPRRLGLSDVVDRQIRAYREDVRKRLRLTDSEVSDLFRLVIRRPDAEEIFVRAGRTLAGNEGGGSWRRRMPRRLGLALARNRVRRRLNALFGRRVGGFGRGAFSVEGRSLLFIEADPGGDACFLVSGLCQAILERTTGRGARVEHVLCQSRGDALCRWEGTLLDDPASIGDAPSAEAFAG
jgi:hypothetical protein